MQYRSDPANDNVARPMRVLDLFSAAAGGWSLGMHRAGFVTVAACEVVEWRRILYAENNPHVRLYDDVRALTAARLVSDLGFLPDIIVGSPPCQDISSANTKGKGIEGERSGLYLEAIRLVGECRPRWFAFENSANLRTRGADAVLAELEALGYACWSFVVRASDIGANHERARSWLIGCDTGQVGHATQDGRGSRLSGRRAEPDQRICQSACGDDAGATPIGLGHVCTHGIRWPWQCDECDYEASNADGDRQFPWPGFPGEDERDEPAHAAPHSHENRESASSLDGEMADSGTVAGDCQPGSPAHADEAGRAHGSLEPGLRQAEVADNGCRSGRCNDGSCPGQMGLCPPDSEPAGARWPQWSLENLADSLRLDDGISAWVAGTRIATGSGKRTSAASLIVEAFGDAVVPQIPEAIGRAILRVEAAMSTVSTNQFADVA